jgi:hypothetical protein
MSPCAYDPQSSALTKLRHSPLLLQHSKLLTKTRGHSNNSCYANAIKQTTIETTTAY